ncbi:unnamed protein product [Hymenolepis diminuta]|uniref:F-box domain-containing protein n=2 Tax=Hymenolepis diminuta TaxID=6216 RepID=A0A158QD89_HYMDI|nr:unnamed protein product [Hymenolepis diminuta]
MADVKSKTTKTPTANRILLSAIRRLDSTPRSGDIKDGTVSFRGNSAITTIKQSLLNHGMVFDMTMPIKSRKMKIATTVVQKRKPISNPWQDKSVLTTLFKHLRPKDVLSCSSVCKLWREILISDYVRDLRLVFDFKRSNQSRRELMEEQLRLAYRWKISGVSLVHMRDEHVPNFIRAYYTTFREFFPQCPISTPELEDESFKSVPDLLDDRSCTDSLDRVQLRRLESAPIEVIMKPSRHITQLTVDKCCLSDLVLEQILTVMHTVTNLSIISCNRLSDMALWSCLRPWTTQLCVRDCLNFKDDALQAIIQSAPGLQELDVQIYHLSDVALGAFLSRRHINLRKLNLTYGSEITFLGMAKLVGFLPSLQELRLIGCSRLNDAAIDLVCEHMRFLQVLEISANPLVTSAALATIGGSLSQLEYLSLDRCILITNEGLRSLEGLSNLQILTLRWCSLLTDEGLLDILKLRRLTFLSLAGGLQGFHA